MHLLILFILLNIFIRFSYSDFSPPWIVHMQVRDSIFRMILLFLKEMFFEWFLAVFLNERMLKSKDDYFYKNTEFALTVVPKIEEIFEKNWKKIEKNSKNMTHFQFYFLFREKRVLSLWKADSI